METVKYLNGEKKERWLNSKTFELGNQYFPDLQLADCGELEIALV